jgi:hypothetical protein
MATRRADAIASMRGERRRSDAEGKADLALCIVDDRL